MTVSPSLILPAKGTESTFSFHPWHCPGTFGMSSLSGCHLFYSTVSLETEVALAYVTYMKLSLLTGRLVEVDLADSPNFTRHIDRVAQVQTELSVEISLWGAIVKHCLDIFRLPPRRQVCSLYHLSRTTPHKRTAMLCALGMNAHLDDVMKSSFTD